MAGKKDTKIAKGKLASKRAGKRTVSRSAVSGRFISGANVRVPLGARTYDATVLEERNGRVRVAIDVRGSDEKVTSSYSVDDLRSTS